MENKEKLTREEVLENFQEELAMLEQMGFTDLEQNIEGLIKYDGILGFFQALYPEFDFDKFEKKTLNGLVIPMDSYVALISAEGDHLKGMEICAPFLYQNYQEIQDAGFKNQQDIFTALFYNTTYYNIATDAVKYLKRKEIFANENKRMIKEFGLNDQELNFNKLYETNGNIVEAVLAIDPKKVYNPIVKKLDEMGLKYTKIEDFENLVLNELKTIENTVAYIKLFEKGKIKDEIIDEVMRENSYNERFSMLELNNWDPYKAVVKQKYIDMYNNYKKSFSPMFIYYICEGLEEQTPKEFEIVANEGSKTLSICKKYGVNVEDPFLNLKVLRFREKAISAMNMTDKSAAKEYVVDIFKGKGYKENNIRLALDFQDFDDDLESQENLIKLISEGHLNTLKLLKEELGNESFFREFMNLSSLLVENEYNPLHTLFEFREYPFEYKEKITSKDEFDAFEQFHNLYNATVSGGFPNYDLLFKNNLDFNLAVMENLFESCFNYTQEKNLQKKFSGEKLFKAAHEAADDVDAFKNILKRE